MVHMLSCSFVHPILEYMKKRWEQQDTDVSLIRHFVFEVNLIIYDRMNSFSLFFFKGSGNDWSSL
jgi:hypothetical protein